MYDEMCRSWVGSFFRLRGRLSYFILCRADRAELGTLHNRFDGYVKSVSVSLQVGLHFFEEWLVRKLQPAP